MLRGSSRLSRDQVSAAQWSDEQKEDRDVMTNVGIIGSGLIGRAWAIVFARGGCNVRLADASRTQAEQALGIIRTGLDDLNGAGLLTESPDIILARIGVASELEE